MYAKNKKNILMNGILFLNTHNKTEIMKSHTQHVESVKLFRKILFFFFFIFYFLFLRNF